MLNFNIYQHSKDRQRYYRLQQRQKKVQQLDLNDVEMKKQNIQKMQIKIWKLTGLCSGYSADNNVDSNTKSGTNTWWSESSQKDGKWRDNQ